MLKINLLTILIILSTIMSLGVNFSFATISVAFAQEDFAPPPTLPASEPAPSTESAPAPTESNPSPAPMPVPAEETVQESNPSPAPLPAPNIQEIINADINITPQDLGVSDQRILPDSPVYPIKEVWREVKSFFTFGAVNKAERRLQYANEKLIETKKLAEKTDNPSVINEALDNYKDELAEVKDRVNSIKEKAEQNSDVDKFLENFIDGNLKQQKLMDKIGNESPAEVFEKLNEVRDDALNKFSEISLGVAEPNKLKEKFEKIAQEQKGSEFKEFKNLEVLKQIQEKLPENAKEAMEKVQKNMMENFKEKMGKFSDDKKETFKDYIKNIPGQELKQMEVFHEFESGKMPEEVRGIIEETKGLAMKKIEEAMMGFGPQGKKEMILKDLEGKKMEDVRIIKELENNLPPEAIGKILEIKNRTLDNVRRQIQDADSPEKQEEFFREIEKFHDVKQLEMFKEIEQVIPPEKKEFFEQMKGKAMKEMKADFERAGDEMDRKMMFQQMASDNPEGMAIMKEFGPPPEIMQEVMKEQIKNLEQKIDNEQDAQKLQILKQRVQEDETVKAELETKNPEIFKKIDARETILNQGMNAESIAQQIQKAKAELEQALSEYGTADQEMIKNAPASQLIDAAKKHIGEAETRLQAGENIFGAFGMATAALHEANSVRRIVKEVDLRKEIGRKRQDEFKQKYEQMNTQKNRSGEPNESGGQFGGFKNEQGSPSQMGQPGEGGGQGTMPLSDFSNVDMMKCAMPEKPQCPGPVSMKKDEQGCPRLFCLDMPNQQQPQESSGGSSQPYQQQQSQQIPKEQYMQYPREPYQQPIPSDSFQQRQPDSSQPYNYSSPELKEQMMQPINQAMPTERIEGSAPSQPMQYAPQPTNEFKPPTQETAPSSPPTFNEPGTLFDKLGAGILMFWDGFLELIK